MVSFHSRMNIKLSNVQKPERERRQWTIYCNGLKILLMTFFLFVGSTTLSTFIQFWLVGWLSWVFKRFNCNLQHWTVTSLLFCYCEFHITVNVKICDSESTPLKYVQISLSVQWCVKMHHISFLDLHFKFCIFSFSVVRVSLSLRCYIKMF